MARGAPFVKMGCLLLNKLLAPKQSQSKWISLPVIQQVCVVVMVSRLLFKPASKPLLISMDLKDRCLAFQVEGAWLNDT